MLAIALGSARANPNLSIDSIELVEKLQKRNNFGKAIGNIRILHRPTLYLLVCRLLYFSRAKRG